MGNQRRKKASTKKDVQLMNRKNIITLVATATYIFLMISYNVGSISASTDQQTTDLQKTTLTKVVDGIQIDLTYYADLAVTGFPVFFEVVSRNISANKQMIHIDPLITIQTESEDLAFFNGHTHDGFYDFRYTFRNAETFTIDVDLFTTGDTTNFMGSEFSFGERRAAFDVTITSDELPDLKIGSNTIVLQGIIATFSPSVENPVIGSFVDLSVTLTQSNGSELKHTTARYTLIDPSGQVVLASDWIHSHNGNLLAKYKFEDGGVYRLIVAIEPTMPPLRTQWDIGQQIASFAIDVSSPSSAPGFEIVSLVFGMFATVAIAYKVKNKR
jgi:hypothetical protein